MVEVAAENFYNVKADNAVGFATREVKLSRLNIFKLPLPRDRLRRRAENIGKPCLDLYKGDNFALAGNYVHFAEARPVIFFQNFISVFL